MTDKKEFNTPRLCHMSDKARKICDDLQMGPSDAIIWYDTMMKKTFDRDEFQKIVNDAVRTVTQVEGVVLNEKQKGFFRELFGSLLEGLKKVP